MSSRKRKSGGVLHFVSQKDMKQLATHITVTCTIWKNGISFLDILNAKTLPLYNKSGLILQPQGNEVLVRPARIH
jgi:hypothetical protein